jgi:5-methylthioadenosine/S-adenosylhomocysteine deaminase
MLDLLIKNARYAVTSNANDEILVGVSIGIKDGKIAYIGSDSPDAKTIFDATDKLISPGLVNSHTHLGMSLLRGWAEGVNLQGFLERVWAAEGAIMDEATCELGTELGALEALLSGTTTTMDMYLNPVATHRGAVRVGLRHIAGPIFFDFPGLDGLQWNQRIERAHQWPAELAKIGGPFIPTYLMPHSTYTDSPENLTEVAAIAKELGARIHLHVSETQAENEDVQSRYSKSPTEVCRDTGILDVPTIFGHGVHLSDSDMKIAASKGASVGHCPGSNLKLGSGLARFNEMRDAGITVGLGTDSCSSSNDLDMFSVMRLAAHVVALRQSPADVDLTSIVRAATIEAAKAVGLGDRVGSIEIGKEADLIALDLHAAHLTPVHDVNALLVFAAGRGDVTDVWVAGDQVVAKRQSTKIDLTDLIKRVNLRVKALEPLK